MEGPLKTSLCWRMTLPKWLKIRWKWNAWWTIIRLLEWGARVNFVTIGSLVSLHMTSFWLISQSESSISMASSDDNSGGRGMLWRRPHPRYFLATKIYFRRISKKMCTCIEWEISHTFLLALSSASSALRAIVRSWLPFFTSSTTLRWLGPNPTKHIPQSKTTVWLQLCCLQMKEYSKRVLKCLQNQCSI